jgi:hypothetical protein
MTTLILDARQSQLVAGETEQVRVIDETGRELGVLLVNPSDEEQPPCLDRASLEELARRLAEPVGELPTTAEVIQRIKERAAR